MASQRKILTKLQNLKIRKTIKKEQRCLPEKHINLKKYNKIMKGKSYKEQNVPGQNIQKL